MPKKFKGENSKASEARAKKEQKKVEEHEKKQKALEDEYWRDDDKHVMRKQQRKDDRDRKRTEQLENKREKDALLAEEMASIKSAKPVSAKVTRAQIDSHREREAAAAAAAAKTSVTPVTDMPLEENVNQLSIEEGARSVDDALTMLSGGRSTEKHPEKRLKAAYAAFEEKNLPILKAENPNFRLSQLKQMLKKDWMKSPENPMNQRIAAFNTK